MPGPHTDRIVQLLTEEGTAALQEIRDEELAAGNFIRDRIVWAADDFLEPRMPNYSQRLVDRVTAKIKDLSGADLLNWIDGVLSESKS